MKHPGSLRALYPFIRVTGLGILYPFAKPQLAKPPEMPKGQGSLILANHLSDIDPVMLQASSANLFHFMAKSELFEMPSIAWALRWWRAFPVQRGTPDRKALRHAVELLRGGHQVVVFPEGRLSKSGELQELNPGAFLIARQAEVPVLCARLDNTHKLLPFGKVVPRKSPEPVRLDWRPLENPPLDDATAFLEQVRKNLQP